MLMRTIQQVCKVRSLLNPSKIQRSLKVTSCQLYPIQRLHTKIMHESKVDARDCTSVLAKVLTSEQMVHAPLDSISIQGPVLIQWDIRSFNAVTFGNDKDICQRILIALREWLHMKGPLFQFRAYGNSSHLPSSVQQSLHDSMVNCLGAIGQQAVDRVMINDIFSFTQMCAPPAVIVLISGDGVFANTLRMLKRLGYTVVTVLPQWTSVHELKGSADHTLYFRDIAEAKIRRIFHAKDRGKARQLGDDLCELVRRHGPIHVRSVHSIYYNFYKERLVGCDSETSILKFVENQMKGILEVSGSFINLVTPKAPKE